MVTKFSIDELNKSSVVSSSSGVHNVLFWVLICVIHAVLYSSGNTRCARYKVCTRDLGGSTVPNLVLTCHSSWYQLVSLEAASAD